MCGIEIAVQLGYLARAISELVLNDSEKLAAMLHRLTERLAMNSRSQGVSLTADS